MNAASSQDTGTSLTFRAREIQASAVETSLPDDVLLKVRPEKGLHKSASKAQHWASRKGTGPARGDGRDPDALTLHNIGKTNSEGPRQLLFLVLVVLLPPTAVSAHPRVRSVADGNSHYFGHRDTVS